MIKRNKGTLILTSIITLIPMVIGLLLWDQLPDTLPNHWDINGNVDGWSSKSFAVFFFPALLLAIQWLCVFASCADPKSKDYHPKMIGLVLWTCPVLSLLLNSMVYAAALGYGLKIEIIMPLIVGLMFVIVGNLLPKCRQSYTMGIKLPWTLNNEENWNKTHRFGGKVWAIGGVIIMATALVGSFWLLIGVMVVMVVAPTLYSYLLYRKQQREA